LSKTIKSLHARKSELASTDRQLEFLSNGIFNPKGLPTFKEKLQSIGAFPLVPSRLEIFQVNVGYMCNQVCQHCHVDAGPDRKEMMTRETMLSCLDQIGESGAHTVDLTGGAPEMNPDFRWFVEQISTLGVKEIIVRSNLTILVSNKKYRDLPSFFREHGIHVMSSLPFYNKDKTDNQRGDGVFEKSIEALRMLNEVGYGMNNSGLKLDLVYNPSGAFLPSSQEGLEREYKKHLLQDLGIHFNNLLALTNLPISRFLDYLIASDNYEEYMESLLASFNPSAVNGVMCRNTLSVGWDGRLFDCDFNQMLNLELDVKSPNIKDFNSGEWNGREIKISQHCYGCTAGAGSSCQGATV